MSIALLSSRVEDSTTSCCFTPSYINMAAVLGEYFPRFKAYKINVFVPGLSFAYKISFFVGIV